MIVSVNTSNKFPEIILLVLLKILPIMLPLPHSASLPLPALTRSKGTKNPRNPFYLLPLEEIP
jgi:hypothetical protein